jgi:hypothetical protein
VISVVLSVILTMILNMIIWSGCHPDDCVGSISLDCQINVDNNRCPGTRPPLNAGRFIGWITGRLIVWTEGWSTTQKGSSPG